MIFYAQHGSLPTSSLRTSSSGWFKDPTPVISQFLLFLIQCDLKVRNRFKKKGAETGESILKIIYLLVRNYFLNINFVVHACLNFTVHWIYEDIYFHRSPRKDIFTACCDKWTALLVKCVRSLFKNEAPRHQPDRSLNCVHSQLDDFTPHCNSDSTNRTNPHIES